MSEINILILIIYIHKLTIKDNKVLFQSKAESKSVQILNRNIIDNSKIILRITVF